MTEVLSEPVNEAAFRAAADEIMDAIRDGVSVQGGNDQECQSVTISFAQSNREVSVNESTSFLRNRSRSNLHSTDRLQRDVELVESKMIQAEEEKKAPLIVNPISVLAVAASSIIGVALRVLFAKWMDPKHENFFQLFTYFLPNVVGSFVMGIAAGTSLKKVLPHTHAAVAVGFCGSLTTFSSWMESTTAPKQFSIAAAEYVSGMCFPFIAFFMGRDFAMLIPESGTTRRVADYGFVIFFVATSLILVIPKWNATWYDDVVYTAVLGPIGALTRYFFGLFLNPRFAPHDIPMGTLVSNLTAFILVACLVHCGKEEKKWCGHASVGIGGALSTVSSWCFDTVTLYAKGMRLRAYAYAFGTSVLGVVILTLSEKINNPADK